MLSVQVFTLSYLITVAMGTIVYTADGPIEGIEEKSASGKTYYSYYSVPFGKSPIGEKRFLHSEPVEPWKEPYNATVEKTNICHQINSNNEQETEDCLYLSVFTPQDPNLPSNNYSVLVNIYGGGFSTGSSRINGGHPPSYLLDEDVIVVYFNYRLGAFGFLATSDGVIPGNAGLSDQILALKWVQKNIAAFGGDVMKVTVSGQSAGAKSVGYLILSEAAKGLFSKAIMESGSPICPGGYQRNHTQIAFRVGSFLDDRFIDNNTNSTELLEVLQSVNATILNNAASHYSSWAVNQSDYFERNPMLQGYYFTPIIDQASPDPLVPDNMYETLVKGQFNQVPVLMGVCSEEGLMDATFKNSEYRRAYDGVHSLLNPQDMNISGDTDWKEVGELIKLHYSPNSSYEENPLAVLKYYTDQEYVRGATKHAELQANVTKVYFYQFSFTGDLDGGNTGFPGSGNVSHVSEIPYIYGGRDLSDYSTSDRLVSKRLVKIWTNFIKYGNPTPKPEELLQNVTWPTVLPGDFYYVNVGHYDGTDLLVTEGKPKNENMLFWDDLYQKFGHRPYDTY